jgi:hypothetical protein
MAADAVKHVVHTALMIVVVRRQIGGLSGGPVARSAARSLVAALLTGAAAFGAAWAVGQVVAGTGTLAWLPAVLVGGAAGVLAYTAAVFALDISETRALPRLLRR